MAAVGDRPMGIIRDLVGHGIGREVHEEPQVPNVGRAGYGPLLREGMVLAIEPMLSLGTDRIRTLDDGWTVVTNDGTRSAHFEHTVAVTADGPRILTGSGVEAATGTSG
jgi:methionyl aminopeptidase